VSRERLGGNGSTGNLLAKKGKILAKTTNEAKMQVSGDLSRRLSVDCATPMSIVR